MSKHAALLTKVSPVDPAWLAEPRAHGAGSVARVFQRHTKSESATTHRHRKTVGRLSIVQNAYDIRYARPLLDCVSGVGPNVQRLFKRAIGHVTRKGLLRLLATVVSVLFIQPAWADAKVEDQKARDRAGECCPDARRRATVDFTAKQQGRGA